MKIVFETVLIGLSALAVTVAGVRFALADEIEDRIAGAFAVAGVEQVQMGPPCFPYDTVAANLLQRFQETPEVYGTLGEDRALVIMLAPTGTYTILSVGTDGVACMIASGESWSGDLPEAPAPSEHAPKFEILPDGREA